METPKNTVPAGPEQKSSQDRLKEVDLLRFFFDLDNVEEQRAQQNEYRTQAIEASRERGYGEELTQYYAGKAVEHSVDTYLDTGGYSRDDEDYGKVKGALMGVSVMGVPDEDWAAKFKEGSTTEFDQSGRDKTRALYEEISGESYYKPESAFSEEDQETLEVWRTELADYRDKMARVAAERQGKLGGGDTTVYRAIYEAYNRHVVGLGQLENEALLNDESIDDETKKVQITEYLFNEQAKLRELTTEKLEGTKVGKFVKWMNKGNVAVRIAKGIGIGLAGGAVAAGIGAIAGVAGAAAVGAGVAGLATAGVRFARGFAMADAKGGRGMDKTPDGVAVLETMRKEDAEPAAVEQAAANPDSKEDYVQRIADYFGRQYEADTKKEQSKRRKSVAWGLGAMALGGAAGAIATHLIIDGATNGFGIRNDPFFGGHEAGATSGGNVEDLGGQDRTEARLEFQEAREAAAEQAAAEAAAEQAAAEEAARQAEILANTPDGNFYIQPGEGGIHFFDRIGLNEAQWYQVQGDLLNQFPQDFYQSPGQAVRLQHSGQLSIEAQKYIKSVFGL